MNQATNGIGEVNENVVQRSAAASQIAREIAKVSGKSALLVVVHDDYLGVSFSFGNI